MASLGRSPVVLLLLIVLHSQCGACQQWVAAEDGAIYEEGYDPTTVVMTPVDYTDVDGASLQGYMVYDNTTADPRPGVVIVPDWDGVGAYEQWRAKLLASLGYVAFVADIYGSNITQGPSLPMSERVELTSMYIGDPLLFRSRVAAAMSQLRSADLVDDTKLAAIGYCFGGTGVLELFRSWPEGTDGLLGVMAFHAGRLVTSAPPTLPNNPIVVSVQHGNDDESVDPDGILSLQDELSSNNVTWEFTSYGGAVHAFTEPSLVPGFGNARYSPFADARSWDALKSFLMHLFGANPYTIPSTVAGK